MKIAIDIPVEVYEFLSQKQYFPDGFDVTQRVMHGTPLPKGHGALADVKSFIKEVCIGSDDMADDWCDNDCENCEYIDNIRTLFKHIVVEADKETDG